MRQLEWPTLLCHRLEVKEDRIINYRLRLPDQKKQAVSALRALNYFVVAAGDSFNDTAMLAAANSGYLFRSPVAIQRQFPQFPAVEEFDDLLQRIEKDMAG